MKTNDDTEYDYERIHGDFQPRTRDRGWTRGLVLGIVLGVLLCTGTTYAIYAGELAYESALQFGDPAPHTDVPMYPPRTEPEARPAEPRPAGNGYSRHRRGWANYRGPNALQE